MIWVGLLWVRHIVRISFVMLYGYLHTPSVFSQDNAWASMIPSASTRRQRRVSCKRAVRYRVRFVRYACLSP